MTERSRGQEALKGIGAFGLVFLLLLLPLLGVFLWAHLNSKPILQDMQESMPRISAQVERPGLPVSAPLADTPSSVPAASEPQEEFASPAPVDLSEPEIALPDAPQIPSGLSETSVFGDLPRRDPQSGQTPYEAFSTPFDISTIVEGQMPFALVVALPAALTIEDLTDFLDRLPPYTTLLVSPYGTDVSQLYGLAKTRNLELWLELPIQPKEYPFVDPGPYIISTPAGLEENREQLYRALSSFSGYAGVIMPDPVAFPIDSPVFELVLEEIFSRGLAMVHNELSDSILIESLAANENIPVSRIHQTRYAPLAQPFPIPKENQIFHLVPHPATLEKLNDWFAFLNEQAYKLVPVSAIMTLKAG